MEALSTVWRQMREAIAASCKQELLPPGEFRIQSQVATDWDGGKPEPFVRHQMQSQLTLSTPQSFPSLWESLTL